jgi:hypothetical protein
LSKDDLKKASSWSSSPFLILRDIHGGDAVINVAEPAAIERTNAEEIDRLKLYYGAEAFSKVYPGSMPKLPTAFAEVGVEASKEANKKAIKADKVN